jgi:hypothetical protein
MVIGISWKNDNMTPDFTNIEYLKSGNTKQRAAYRVLTDNHILEMLKEYDPILVGTIPINISVESSDLDIVCYAKDLNAYGDFVVERFGEKKGFTIWERGKDKLRAVVASFIVEGFDIEVFGQNIPSTDQQAYRHMIIEYRLLVKHGEEFRRKVIALKQMGYKTEPAFAKLLGLEGDAYQALLALEKEKT